jgi:predicted component of viral defense system (DUF524 family)
MQLRIVSGDGSAYTLWPEARIPEGAISEDSVYTLQLVDLAEAENRAGCHLLMGGIDLGAGRLEGNGALSWTWQVNEYVGRVRVELEQAGKPLIRATETLVEPNRHKLTQTQFAAMVEDIAEEAEIAYSLSPATQQVALRQQWQRLGLSQLEYLDQRLTDLQRAVEAIARRPLRRLEEETVKEPLASAPMVDGRSLVKLVQRLGEATYPQPQLLPAGARRLQKSLHGALPDAITVHRHRISYDVYENRLLKHFLGRLYRVVLRTHRALLDAAENKGLDEEIRRLARHRAEQLTRHQRILYNLMALDFLDDVGPIRAIKPVTSALRKDPFYSRFHALYREFDRAISPFDGGPFSLSMEKTWQLYEYWCFFQVVAALREVCSGMLSFDARGLLKPHADRVSLAMPNAEVAITDKVSVHFQKTYSYYGWSADRAASRAGTYSHEMRPDISVEIRDDTGDVAEIILLDPKYRAAAGSINEGLSDMHQYKDAIVDADRKRLVRCALVLCPTDAQARTVYFDRAYIRTHGLGVVALAPERRNARQRLTDLLAEQLGDRLRGGNTDSAII